VVQSSFFSVLVFLGLTVRHFQYILFFHTLTSYPGYAMPGSRSLLYLILNVR
jgi:hypothetical protein